MGNSMIFGLAMLAIIYVLWILLVKGFLWKSILAIGGWFGIWGFLNHSYEWASNSGISAFDIMISWSIIIPTFILLMAMAYTREA